MKNAIYIILCSITILFGSCANGEPDIFPASPAERLNNALKVDKDSLINADNGWAMEYFATTQSAGYTMLMKFNKSGQVVVAGKNDLTRNTLVSDSSLYEMIGDNGPVLTFNSYNNILHAFSNPVNPDGYGLEGDYEFVVMKTVANQIVLKGKKRGTTILLNKITQNISWKKYFDDIEAMNTLLFNGSTNSLSLVIENDTTMAYNGSTHIFRITKQGEDPNVAGENYPIIVTPKGLRLHTAYTINGKSVQTFELTADKQRLVCTDAGVNAYLTGPNPAKLFVSNSTIIWKFDFTKPMGTEFEVLYNKIVASCQTQLSESFTYLYFRNNPARNSFTLTFKSGKYTGNFDFNRTNAGDNKVKLAYKSTADINASYYYNNIDGFKELIQLVGNKTYIVSKDGFSLNSLKFTAESNPAISFYVTQ